MNSAAAAAVYMWLVALYKCYMPYMGEARTHTFHLTNGWAWGHLELKKGKQETDQTVLTSQKRSPKRLIVLLEPKSGGARPKKSDRCPHFCSIWTGAPPHFQIRSGATEWEGRN